LDLLFYSIQGAVLANWTSDFCVICRRFALEDVLNVGIELVAHLSQGNFILFGVTKSERLLLFGLGFILLLIPVWISSFLGHPLGSFPLHMIFLVGFFAFGRKFKVFAVGVGVP
jgi:hypothetical protein